MELSSSIKHVIHLYLTIGKDLHDKLWSEKSGLRRACKVWSHVHSPYTHIHIKKSRKVLNTITVVLEFRVTFNLIFRFFYLFEIPTWLFINNNLKLFLLWTLWINACLKYSVFLGDSILSEMHNIDLHERIFAYHLEN